MKNFAEKVVATVYETNEKGQLKQNVRNAFKAEAMKALADLFAENDLMVYITEEGLAVEFANDELGALTVVFDGTVKGLDYDAVTAGTEYAEKLAEKAEKAKAAEALKAQKIAEKEALKAKTAEKKVKATK